MPVQIIGNGTFIAPYHIFGATQTLERQTRLMEVRNGCGLDFFQMPQSYVAWGNYFLHIQLIYLPVHLFF